MSMHGSRSKLAALTGELAKNWEQTKESWRDAKSLEFEKQYLAELFGSVNTSLSSIETLERIVTKVRNDCE